jgi:hypothetical protein
MACNLLALPRQILVGEEVLLLLFWLLLYREKEALVIVIGDQRG